MALSCCFDTAVHKRLSIQCRCDIAAACQLHTLLTNCAQYVNYSSYLLCFGCSSEVVSPPAACNASQLPELLRRVVEREEGFQMLLLTISRLLVDTETRDLNVMVELVYVFWSTVLIRTATMKLWFFIWQFSFLDRITEKLLIRFLLNYEWKNTPPQKNLLL